MQEPRVVKDHEAVPAAAHEDVERDAFSFVGEQEPIRAEPFSLAHLQEHARELAALHVVARGSQSEEREFLARFESNSEFLPEAYAAILQAVQQGETITPAAEWLIDNFYIVQEQLREIRQDLPRGYYHELPKLSSGPLAGHSRVYALALRLIAHTDSALDEQTFTRFVHAYQSVSPLLIGEVWAVPIMLRLALVENLRRLAAQMLSWRRDQQRAHQFVEGSLRRRSGGDGNGQVAPTVGTAEAEGLSPAFAAQVVEWLREQGNDQAPCVQWLEERLALQASSIEDILRRAHQQQASNQVSTGNAITSMRLLSNLDWNLFFERTNLVEGTLRQDPAEVYGRMDFSTRDRYRHVVEQMARRTRRSEQEVAERAVELARRPAAADSRRRHVGYFLVEEGRDELEAALGLQPGLAQRGLKWLRTRPTLVYLGGIALLTGLPLAALLLYLLDRASPAALIIMGLAALIPASELAISVANWLVTALLRPRVLPKVEFKDGIPDDCQTIVVMPTMLFSEEGVHTLLERLEIHYLANPEPGLAFALLTDFADAPAEHQPSDAPLLEEAVHSIRALNARYPEGGPRFYLFHRGRRWNPAEKKWMGWERKRGKLHEFNRLLRGATDTSHSAVEGDLSALRAVKYVITLDTDTQLPRGVAKRLIGTLAHPLNRAAFDPRVQRVVEGYGILQPRVSVNLASAARSPFARIFSGNPGMDLYTTACSDVYQDLFAEGSYTGKGIYDLDAFETAVGQAFPENSILSHDLIEGCHARVGLVTDIVLYDEFPARYHAYARRQHRWIRGDWQLLPWLFRRVPAAAGRRPNPMNVLSRWKIFDNLRRSVVMPALLVFLGLGWCLVPGLAWLWTGVSLLVLGFPFFAQIGSASLVRPDSIFRPDYWRDSWPDLRTTLAQAALMLTFLAHQAVLITDAILRTLARLAWTRHRLLEWETASATERRLGEHAGSFFVDMWPAPVLALVLLWLVPAAAYPAALPLLALWLVSPLVAYLVSRPTQVVEVTLAPGEVQTLRRIARRTWSFFERFVVAADHWLPPDNYQEQPREDVAHRLSPTNEGLFLVSALAAHDLGFLGHRQLASLLEHNLDSLERLEQYRGHFYNWYDTQTLTTLRPRYVSTVDSGNLVGCLQTLRQGLLEKMDERLFTERLCDGIRDSARLVEEALTRVHPPGARFVSPPLGQLEGATRQVLTRLQAPPPDLPAWNQLLRRLEGTTRSMPEQLGQIEAEIHLKADELRCHVRQLALQIREVHHDFETLLPWVALLEPSSLPHALAAAPAANGAAPDETTQHWQRLWSVLTADVTLQGLIRLGAGIEPELEAIRTALANRRDEQAAKTLARLEAVRQAVQAGAAAAAEAVERYLRLAGRCHTLASGMDFQMLYDPNRRLFSIGYNLEESRLDSSYYDLLATEARLASLLAISKGDTEPRHWFHLGRPLTQTAGSKALVSWGGTMFEYLMPLLFTRLYPNTLLEHTCLAAVDRQIEYGRQRQVPWGISESGFSALNATLHYQYQSFGVPGLGLKRGLAKDLVISPYSTALALMVRPRPALANFRALQREGAEGAWGFYEAIDYTPDRVPPGQRSVVVRNYMAHHQGMSLVALANALLHNCMQRRFHSQPMIRATELLLQERLPVGSPLVQPHGDEVETAPIVRDLAAQSVSRRLTAADTPAPRTHLISNGRYSVMVTNAGGGYSSCQGVLLTRWRPDTTRDPWGHFLYLRDLRSGRVWSAAAQPVPQPPERYEVLYSSDRAEFRRQDEDVETHLVITVSPESNAEVRQLTLTNHGRRSRDVEVTGYVEVALAPPAADLAHPAFSKLFIQTEFVPAKNALLAGRRPRSADQQPLWAVYVLAADGGAAEALEYETDRARFLGRGGTPAAPAALEAGARLSGSVGAVLDPILSLRRRVRLGPGQSSRLAFNLALAGSREEALALADQLHDPRVVLRTLELAWAHSQVELRHLHLSPGDAHLFQRLASPLLYPDPAYRAPASVRAANRLGQAGLWPYSISGDYPIVLVRLTDQEQMRLVRELLLAHEYWRSRGLVVDLVVLNDHPASYDNALQEALRALVEGTIARSRLNKPGGLFLLQGAPMPEADRTLLQAVASVVLDGERGPLAEQLEKGLHTTRLPPRLVPQRTGGSAELGAGSAERGEVLTAPRSEFRAPSFFNGLGGFSADGTEYAIELAPGQWTPAPWINVLANPSFGCLVSEAGAGYTWSENSRENKLTPWANDPVSDPPGEALYLRDEDTGEVWSPTPLPARDDAPYTVRHRPGASRFGHRSHGIDQELLLAVAEADPVKFFCLRLRNDSGRPRSLSATLYAEWVLGVNREQTQLHVFTEIDEETKALLARNPYSQDFGRRLAFLTVVGREHTLTGDRAEFFGRNGSLQRPEALTRTALSDRTGAGFDPCGCVQTRVTLAPGEETEVIFLLGQAEDVSQVRVLLGRYAAPEQVHAAVARVQAFWEDLLTTVQVKTPNAALDVLLNRWLLYQVLSCRVWGRSALYQSGGAYGYRDQLQDVMALVYSRPHVTREQILRAAGRQFEEGDVQHWWHPPIGRGIRTRFSDDYLWLPLVTCHYVQATGDRAILDERVPFLRSPPLEPNVQERYELPEVSAQSDTLYGHCLRALDHGLRFGRHGLPLMGCGDWNDGMNLVGAGGQGESVWVAWFLLYIFDRFVPLVEARGDAERAAHYRGAAERLYRAIEEQAWDGAWYRRAYFDDGTPLGSAQNEECQIDSLPQSWAVMARGDTERSRQALRAVDERLVRRREGLVLLFTPPFDRAAHDPGYIKGYLPGVRENGGQYTHAALWVVEAFARLGDGDRAMELLDLLNPVHHGGSEGAEAVYKVEPYVVAADVYDCPPHVGRGGWTWYTGSAAWMYRVGLESLLGWQLRGDVLRIEPCIPAAWPGFEFRYRRGSATYHVTVENPQHVQRGVRQVVCDGQELPNQEIPLADDGKVHEVRVVMG